MKSNSKWIMVVLCILAVLILLSLVMKGDEKITWYGFYYPKGEVSANIIDEKLQFDQAPKFSTLQDCMHWGRNYIKSNNDGFECSYGCRIEENLGLICKDTTKMITR